MNHNTISLMSERRINLMSERRINLMSERRIYLMSSTVQTKETRLKAMKVVTVLSLFGLLVSSSLALERKSNVNCKNSSGIFVRIRMLGIFPVFRTCRFIKRRQSKCKEIDRITGKLVGLICAKECPKVSACSTEDESSYSPTRVPIPQAPTPILSPTPPNPSVPVISLPIWTPLSPVATAPVLPPIQNLPIPSEPYITISTSSEVVTIPRPPKPTGDTGNSNCPHTQTDLKNWHVSSTWGISGIVPYQDGQDVTIPAGSKVLIDQTVVPTLGVITIPFDSELIIGTSSSNDIKIDVTGFKVFGKLIAGSETCRITTNIDITLHGKRPMDVVTNIPPPEYKGISVEGGILSLHGERFYNTWTRLAKTAKTGDRILLLQENVNWQPGQIIVLITSVIKDSRDYHQNEVLEIESVNSDHDLTDIGSVVYLAQPVQYSHTAIGSYQVEVGLLTRTIRIQGNEHDSEPVDTDPGTCEDINTNDKWQIYYNTTQPCLDKELTGYGGHVMVSSGGLGQVSGVEFYLMGQTNVLGRYPMHFHILNNCPECYLKDSSIHRSFYRCVAIHGSHNTTVTENVAYDVTGHCFYLEDGVEEDNTISYNLAAHIHTIGPDLVRINGHTTKKYYASESLTIPADVTASGFYITNVHNNFIGNAASGGWSGFSFPSLLTGLATFRNIPYKPANVPSLIIDGNTAHSTAWWWRNAGAFYVGGALYYNNENQLVYDPGTSKESKRSTCLINTCLEPFNNCDNCEAISQTSIRISNSKVFLSAGIGFQAWTGKIDVVGFEAHDTRLSLQAISSGFSIDNSLIVCRTGEDLGMPSRNTETLEATGLVWYDTNQKHILTKTTFRNCGYRSDELNQYDQSPYRGCVASGHSGCHPNSVVFGFLTASDQFTPEIMQASREMKFENCGRRFRFDNGNQSDTVSGRNQNWIDSDGSVTGFENASFIVSGLDSMKDWWGVDSEVRSDVQAPLRFIRKADGPNRELGFFRMRWDSTLHSNVGKSICTNAKTTECPWEGFVRHAGRKFSPITNPNTVNNGNPITARGDVVGLTGGFGWIFDFNKTAPRSINFYNMEINPSSKLLISIPYPKGAQFQLTVVASPCRTTTTHTCNETFTTVDSIDEVRDGAGNTYHVDDNGVLTFRLAQPADQYTGNPIWSLPNYTTPAKIPKDVWALGRFERNGIRLPQKQWAEYFLRVRCPSDNDSSPKDGYCPQIVPNYNPDVCEQGFVQMSFDRCCQKLNLNKCIYADGSKNF